MMAAGVCRKKGSTVLLGATGAVLLLVLLAPVAGIRAQESLSLELDVQRRAQSASLVPVDGDYVGYDVTIKNTGGSPIEAQLVWVRFVSASGNTDSKAVFSVPTLAPGASTQLHLGPFKMLEGGQHCLYLGVNKDGDFEAPNEIAFNYAPDSCADSIQAYHPALASAIPAGAGLTAAGAALIGWYLKTRMRP